MKLNIPAYYGLGVALESLIDEGYEQGLKELYQESLFFRTLLDNAMQALRKSYLPLTTYLERDSKFGDLVKKIRAETARAEAFVLRIVNQKRLLEKDSVIEASITQRERLILPLLVIQHCALQKICSLDDGPEKEIWRKVLLKSIPANINASRNSA